MKKMSPQKSVLAVGSMLVNLLLRLPPLTLSCDNHGLLGVVAMILGGSVRLKYSIPSLMIRQFPITPLPLAPQIS